MGNFEKLGVLVIIILAVVIMIILIGGGPQEALEPEHERAADQLYKPSDRPKGEMSRIQRDDSSPVDDNDGDWPDGGGRDQPEPPIPDDRIAPVPPPPVLEDIRHTVARGDNPYNLAEKYYGPGNGKYYRQILAANPGVTASNLSIGMVLTIPHRDKILGGGGTSDGGGAGAGGGTAADRSSGGDTYVVQKGDSLWKIAEKTLGRGSDYRRIQDANRDVLAGGTDVSPGMELRIPR